jgi:hypothetical protein
MATTQQAGVGLSKAQRLQEQVINSISDPYSFSWNLCAAKPHANGA